MANWPQGIFRRHGLVVTSESMDAGRAQKQAHDQIAHGCRLFLDTLGLERSALPKPLRRYVREWKHGVNRKMTYRPEVLDYLRFGHRSPSLKRLCDDLALVRALLTIVLVAGEEGRRRAGVNGGQS